MHLKRGWFWKLKLQIFYWQHSLQKKTFLIYYIFLFDKDALHQARHCTAPLCAGQRGDRPGAAQGRRGGNSRLLGRLVDGEKPVRWPGPDSLQLRRGDTADGPGAQSSKRIDRHWPTGTGSGKLWPGPIAAASSCRHFRFKHTSASAGVGRLPLDGHWRKWLFLAGAVQFHPETLLVLSKCWSRDGRGGASSLAPGRQLSHSAFDDRESVFHAKPTL